MIEPINAVFVQPHSLFPPTTNTWLGEIGTAILPNQAGLWHIFIEPDPGVDDGEESIGYCNEPQVVLQSWESKPCIEKETS